MQRLLGDKSNIFITPYDLYNNNTIKAMTQLGLRVLSSGAGAENHFDQNKSVFVDNNYETQQTVYHLPTTITYREFVNGTWIKIPLKQILTAVDNNIAKYGYAVIVLHPQDFAKSIVSVDKNGQYVNLVDSGEITNISSLIDSIVSKNIHITSFSKIVGIQQKSISSLQ